MGYRVGNECFSSIETATSYKVAQIVPVISSNGTVFSPVQKDGDWFVNGQKIIIDFPSCSVEKDFYDGMQISGAFFSLFVVAFCLKFLINFVNKLGTSAADTTE